MGFLEKRKTKAETRQREEADREYEQAVTAWQQRVSEMEALLEEARGHHGSTAAEAGSRLTPRKGELVFISVDGAGLVEPQRLPGRFEGGYSGVSVRLAKGLYWRVGGGRGTYVPGPERQTLIDQGEAVITDQRVVFLGSRQSREWAYSKLLGIQHDEEVGATYLQVSNRQKVSGIAYGPAAGPRVRFRLDLALAHYSQSVDQFTEQLQAHAAVLRASRPELPAALLPPPAPD